MPVYSLKIKHDLKKLAKKAYKSGRNIIDVAEEETDLSREQLIKILDPIMLTKGGISK